MNEFIQSCNTSAIYPKNLIFPAEYQHSLQNYVDQLRLREKELFVCNDTAALDFWELDDEATSTSMLQGRW